MLRFNTAESNEYLAKLQKESEGVTVFSILICTTKDRRLMFNTLMQEFNRQIDMAGFKGKGIEIWAEEIPFEVEGKSYAEDGSPYLHIKKHSFKHPDVVEIVFDEDEKQMSVGAKRQKLLLNAHGNYITYFDSDDFPKPNYVQKIMKAIEDQPDCIGFKIEMTTNGVKPQTCIHSLSNKSWYQSGDTFFRSVTHFNPVKKELALQTGFKNLRYGEDKDYSDRITPLCKQEVFIDEFLFSYRYSTAVPHEEKYGITN